jgi:hypothetical protein
MNCTPEVSARLIKRVFQKLTSDIEFSRLAGSVRGVLLLSGILGAGSCAVSARLTTGLGLSSMGATLGATTRTCGREFRAAQVVA